MKREPVAVVVAYDDFHLLDLAGPLERYRRAPPTPRAAANSTWRDLDVMRAVATDVE